ncbi:MAG: creatininase family protein [Candidatus Hodarchaeales archaeon]
MPVNKAIKSIELELLTWVEAEKVFKEYEVVIIALGARTKEHGPNLKLNNDYIMTEYLKKRIMERLPVIVLPTLQYGYYPAFLEYPGSISLKADTFKNVIVEICGSIAHYGLKKFYILNTGISTLKPLEKAAVELKNNFDVELRYLNLLDVDKKIPENLLEQEGGTHADESETSMMLYIAPETVDMSKAVKDFDSRPDRKGLTRDPDGTGLYSPTGIWGDPTLANSKKGKIIVEMIVEAIIDQLKELIEF